MAMPSFPLRFGFATTLHRAALQHIHDTPSRTNRSAIRESRLTHHNHPCLFALPPSTIHHPPSTIMLRHGNGTLNDGTGTDGIATTDGCAIADGWLASLWFVGIHHAVGNGRRRGVLACSAVVVVIRQYVSNAHCNSSLISQHVI